MDIDIASIAACAAAFIAAISFFKSMRDKRLEQMGKKIDIGFQRIDEKFKEVHSEFREFRQEIHAEFKIIHHEISEIKQRLAFIETAMCFVDIIPDSNARSEAARKAWAKRRTRQIEKD